MAQQYNPGRVRQSAATPPPVDAPLFENGQITLVWQAWLYQQFTTGKLVQDLAVLAAFEPEAGTDVTAEIEQAVVTLQDSTDGQFAGDIDDLRNKVAASDAPNNGLYGEFEALKSLVASVEVNRPGSEVVFLQGTHAQRLALYPPKAYVSDSTIWETDRTVFYIKKADNWYYLAGRMLAVIASRPSDLVATDVGFFFFATDLGRGYRWDGAAWVDDPTSILLNTDALRVNAATGQAIVTGGGSAPNAGTVCFGDGAGNWAFIFGANVSGVFKNRFAILDNGSLFLFAGSTPTVIFQVSNTGVVFPQNTTSGLYSGAGSPEGVIPAGVGSVYLQDDAAGGCAIWNKETGAGNTGWKLLLSSTSIIDAAHGGTGQAGGYTKGDILVAASSIVLTPLPVGADGDTLIADSAQTLGVKWDVPAAGETNNFLEDHSGGISLSASYAATGIAVTLNQDGYWLIIGSFDANVNTAGGLFEGALSLNGGSSMQAGVCTLLCAATGDSTRAAVSRPWIYHNIGGATPTAELYARIGSTGGGGGGNVFGTNTTIVAVFLHS